MKQLETTQKTIGDATFYIKPFPAFVAANISGELANLIAPLFGGMASVAGAAGDDDVMDMNIEDALPALSNAFSSLSGDKFERLMKKLLIDNRNISVECETTNGDVKLLTYDLANEVFCGEVQDMYILCFEVIKLNFGGFFKKLAGRFGSLRDLLQTKTPTSESGESLTTPVSANLN